ncbi:MAG: SufS family cysteine desulfurase [Planctomycetota bacterium]|nr:MAG: SufS family cysteine desulfurase [Planctomycetota bacterium]
MNHHRSTLVEDLGQTVRADFPILDTHMRGHPLVYLDNGATTQKPRQVIDALVHYYTHLNANVHRGMYELSQRATEAFESARRRVATFLHAPDHRECIFVKGTTEAINLVANSWAAVNLGPGDEIVITGLEHHSNIVPWQMACQRTGAKLRVVYSDEHGRLSLDAFQRVLSDRTRIVAMQHVSNALGIIHPVQEMVAAARAVGAVTMLDGAQWVGHQATDVQALGCDFYAFSGHKLYGPTGIGVLWGRAELLESMPPYQGGGDMIESVAFEKTTYAPLPNKFEAGTPHIAGAIGLAAAIEYVAHLGWDRIFQQENQLLEYATERLQAIAGLRILGNARPKAAIISFVLEDPPVAPLDIARALDEQGIAIRAGHHCCMPLMGQLQVTGTCRASMAFYNTMDDIDRLADALEALVGTRQKQELAQDRSGGGEAGGELADQIVFAPAWAGSVEEAADRLAEEFLEFDDRESKTELLMDMAHRLPHAFAALKQLSPPVPGCMSEVYLVGRPCPNDPQKFEFAADSNAEVVRGLIALLQRLFSGQAADAILQFDTDAFFRRIGLDEFVSTQRRSGLNGMIQRIHALARAAGDTPSQDDRS